jgi:hypothetical protein
MSLRSQKSRKWSFIILLKFPDFLTRDLKRGMELTRQDTMRFHPIFSSFGQKGSSFGQKKGHKHSWTALYFHHSEKKHLKLWETHQWMSLLWKDNIEGRKLGTYVSTLCKPHSTLNNYCRSTSTSSISLFHTNREHNPSTNSPQFNSLRTPLHSTPTHTILRFAAWSGLSAWFFEKKCSSKIQNKLIHWAFWEIGLRPKNWNIRRI